MFHRRNEPDPAAVQNAAIIAVVASESEPYTNPDARYPRAQQYRQQRAEGVARRPDPQSMQAAA